MNDDPATGPGEDVDTCRREVRTLGSTRDPPDPLGHTDLGVWTIAHATQTVGCRPAVIGGRTYAMAGQKLDLVDRHQRRRGRRLHRGGNTTAGARVPADTQVEPVRAGSGRCKGGYEALGAGVTVRVVITPLLGWTFAYPSVAVTIMVRAAAGCRGQVIARVGV